ncbi:MAG: methionine/alanine import NSS transporter subunit MetS [Corynebacterium sp.]|nr:methionine/alanine import NSS transporter subunit MetS [Corynebacterium sp.]
MSSTALIMMLLFMVVIWGGFAISLWSLTRNPDESSGLLGERKDATDEILSAQELDEPRVVPRSSQDVKPK